MRYKYKTVYSDRKSVSVIVSVDNKITVRCPWGMHGEEIERFLDSKAEWIERAVSRNAAKLAWNDDVISGSKIYLNGKKVPLIVSDKRDISDSAVYIKRTEDIERLYINYCKDAFLRRVEELSKITRLNPRSVSIKGYTGRWGCCDAKNNLIFNYKLFMLPQNIQDYVIVHELCHTLCHNHSPAYWKLVSEFVPDYKRIKKEIKNYDFIASLY